MPQEWRFGRLESGRKSKSSVAWMESQQIVGLGREASSATGMESHQTAGLGAEARSVAGIDNQQT